MKRKSAILAEYVAAQEQAPQRWTPVVVPSWFLSVAMHSVLLFLIATNLKGCGPGGVGGGGSDSPVIGAFLTEGEGGGTGEGGQNGESSEWQTEPVESQVFTAAPASPIDPNASIVDDRPPVETLLPSVKPSTVFGAGPPAGTSLALPQVGSLQSGTGVRPSGKSGAPGGGPTGGAPGEVSFLGTTDAGLKFVFVLDCSASMDGPALAAAKNDLKASLQQMEPNQEFQIIFYNMTPTHMRAEQVRKGQLMPATESYRSLAAQFINTQQGSGGTNHMPALQLALSFRPDVVFFLTDGDQPRLEPGEIEQLARECKDRTHIHCIEFGNGGKLAQAEGNFLKKLARVTGGTYRYHDLENILSKN